MLDTQVGKKERNPPMQSAPSLTPDLNRGGAPRASLGFSMAASSHRSLLTNA